MIRESTDAVVVGAGAGGGCAAKVLYDQAERELGVAGSDEGNPFAAP